VFGVVYGGGDAGAFAAAADADAEVAAGVLAVTGACGACEADVGVAAGVLPGVVVLAGLEPLFTADVAFSALAAIAADLALGAAAAPVVVAAADDGALALAGGMAVA
jgi:hypothetical protein